MNKNGKGSRGDVLCFELFDSLSCVLPRTESISIPISAHHPSTHSSSQLIHGCSS